MTKAARAKGICMTKHLNQLAHVRAGMPRSFLLSMRQTGIEVNSRSRCLSTEYIQFVLVQFSARMT